MVITRKNSLVAVLANSGSWEIVSSNLIFIFHMYERGLRWNTDSTLTSWYDNSIQRGNS